MKTRSPSKRAASRPLLCLTATAMLVLSGCGSGQPKAEPAMVAVARAERRTLTNSLTLQGEFYPYQDVILHAKVSGYVNPIRVDIGDHVKQGELLATLEVPELRNQLEGARASARKAEADHAAAHLAYQRLVEVNREHPNLVAQQDLDDAQSKDDATAAALALSAAEVDRLVTLTDYTRVTAPFAGIVTHRFIDNGTLVEAGTTSNAGPVVELAQNDLLRLRFPVPESATPLVAVGGRVAVSVDSVHRNFTGSIARDSWAIDRSTRTMVVEVDVPNPDNTLQAGMYASVTLPTQSASAVAVPLQALSSGDRPTVLVVDAGNIVRERPVEMGIRTPSFVEIRSGVAAGELVVVSERSGLAPGEAVTPKLVDASTESGEQTP